MDVSADAPYLDCAYKIEEYAGIPRRKKSAGKETWPGRKQVYRHFENGTMHHDSLVEAGEEAEGQALLKTVMRDGRRLAPSPPLDDIREYAANQLAALPTKLQNLMSAGDYSVDVSTRLRTLADQIDLAPH